MLVAIFERPCAPAWKHVIGCWGQSREFIGTDANSAVARVKLYCMSRVLNCRQVGRRRRSPSRRLPSKLLLSKSTNRCPVSGLRSTAPPDVSEPCSSPTVPSSGVPETHLHRVPHSPQTGLHERQNKLSKTLIIFEQTDLFCGP